MPNIQFQFRRGSATEWSNANTVLANGEIGIETTTSQFKIGNGTTPWNNLVYGGLQGNIGYTGSLGGVGYTGSAGDAGALGYTGSQGNIGFTGSSGALGYTGSAGVLGNNVTLIQFQETTVAPGNITGNVSFDVSTGTVFTATITGNISNLALANVNNGTSATLILTHAGGPYTLTTTSAWKFAGNVKTLSTTANATDIISVVHVSNTYYAAITKGFV